jgi:hypothetical protein
LSRLGRSGFFSNLLGEGKGMGIKLRRASCPVLLCLLLWAGPPPAAGGGKPFEFPPVDGWTLAGQPQVFSPDALYEYIDGGADLYLKYEFQELQVAEYRKDKASVTVEVYRHREARQAFGIYSQERLPSADFVVLGTQGYYESSILNFLQDCYYVKMSSENTGAEDREVLLAFGQRVSRELGGSASLPGILSALPSEGRKRNSEKFVHRDFLGYSFLHAGFTAEYEVSGKTFQLFVIEGESPSDARTMLEGLFGRSRGPGGKVVEGLHHVKDPYHGEIDLFWKGKHLWGTLGLVDPDLRSRYLRQLEESASRW